MSDERTFHMTIRLARDYHDFCIVTQRVRQGIPVSVRVDQPETAIV